MCTQLHGTYFIYTKMLISEKYRICLLSKCWLKWVIFFFLILHQYFYRNNYSQKYGKFLFLVDAFSEQVFPFGFEVSPNENNCNQIKRDDFR